MATPCGSRSREATAKDGGWTVATNQVCPLGAGDYSSSLLNIADSGAHVFININFGNDAVQSIKQAKQFGVRDKMTLVMAYKTPFFLARDVGPDQMQGVYAATDFWWTLQDRYPLATEFVAAFEKKYNYKPEWSANSGYMQFALWAGGVSHAATFVPPAVITSYESGRKIDSTVGQVWFRAADHRFARPVIIQRGKKKADMKESRRPLRDRPGGTGPAADAGTGCIRLQAGVGRLTGLGLDRW